MRVMPKGWMAVVVAVLLMVMMGEIAHAVWGESLTWDEGDHIFAGYESWKTHDYGLNPEHPPMVKMLATLPLLGLPLKVPALQGRYFKTEAYLDGRELLFRNGPAFEARSLIFRVRMVAMLFAVVTGLLVFTAGTEMFGGYAGLLGLVLFCFEPNLLAHGAYVTTDMAASCTIFATVYVYWRWWRRPTWGRLLVVGLAAGLGLAAKHSAVLLAPMPAVLALGMLLGQRRGSKDWMRAAGSLLVLVLVGVTVLWGFYGFRYAARPPGLVLAPSLTDYVGPLAGTEARGILFAARWHLLPESWLYGLADVRAMANGMQSYFFGTVYEHGVWFYFPVLFLIKSTLGMLALLVLTAVAAVRGWVGRWVEVWFLALPPGLYLVVAMGSHLNIGARHILLVWVFGCVLAGAGMMTLIKRGRGWAWVTGLLLMAHVGSSLAVGPNYIAYANEAWGGPGRTYRYLTDSNTDWAQQLVATSAYLQARGVKQCYIAYFAAPFILPADYGIPCKLLPTYDTTSVHEVLEVPPVIDGPVLISAGDLTGFEFGSKVLNPYQGFAGLRPTAFLQNGMFVFDGRFAVPLASALGHVQRSEVLMKQKDLAGSLEEAEVAERTAPGEVATEMQLGEVLGALGKGREAAAAYDRAGMAIATMEPEARAQWEATLAEKRKVLR